MDENEETLFNLKHELDTLASVHGQDQVHAENPENFIKVEEDLFPCSECDKVFKDLKLVAKHIRDKHRNVWYQCRICRKNYKNRFTANIHLEKVHGRKDKSLIVLMEEGKKGVSTPKKVDNFQSTHKKGFFKCSICQKTAIYRKALVNHLYSEHLETNETFIVSQDDDDNEVITAKKWLHKVKSG